MKTFNYLGLVHITYDELTGKVHEIKVEKTLREDDIGKLVFRALEFALKNKRLFEHINIDDKNIDLEGLATKMLSQNTVNPNLDDGPPEPPSPPEDPPPEDKDPPTITNADKSNVVNIEGNGNKVKVQVGRQSKKSASGSSVKEDIIKGVIAVIIALILGVLKYLL